MTLVPASFTSEEGKPPKDEYPNRSLPSSILSSLPFFRPFPSNEYLFPRIAVAARESIPLSVSEARTAIEKAAEDGANQKQPTDDDGCWLQRRRRPRGRNRFGHENGSGNCRGRRSAEPKIGRIERRSADMAPYQHITVRRFPSHSRR